MRRPIGRLSGLAVLVAMAASAADARAVTFFGSPTTIDSNSEWTNYLRLADLNGDGHMDLIVPNCGGFFANPSPQPLRFYSNGGSANFTEVTASALGGNVSAPVRVVAVADVDGDGDLDVYAPSAGGSVDALFINAGGGTFADEASTRLPANLSSHSAGARFGDVDNDGDADLLVASGYAFSDTPYAHLYLNDGSGVFVAAPGNVPSVSAGADPDDVDFLDVDRDFDLDVLINAHNGKSALWLNDGSGVFSDGSAQMAGPAGNNNHYNPSACDVDNDGDLDIWVDNIGGSFQEQLLINDGDGNFSDETSQRVTNNPSADDNGVVCADVDNDGFLDAIVVSLANEERVLLNDGTGHFAHETGSFPAQGDSTLWLDVADLNGDGRLDVVTGQGETQGVNRVYLGNTNVPVDNRPPVIVAEETLAGTAGAADSPVLRFAVRDAVVSDDGPRLGRAYVRVTVDGGTPTEVEATFMGGDLFRAALPPVAAQGASVSVQPCATDRQGNNACGQMQTYTIMGAGAGGAGGTSASGGAGSGGNPTTSGAGGNGGDPLDVDDGCGCSVPGSDDGRVWGLWALAAAVGLAGLRRRPS